MIGMGDSADGRRSSGVPSLALVLLPVLGCVVDDPAYLGPPGSGASSSSTGGSTSSMPEGSSSESTSTATADVTTQTTDVTGETDDVCMGWWDSAWSRRRRIDIDNTGQDEDLEDFTVLVTLDSESFDFEATAPDGIDLRFVDDDGQTVLAHHVERWDPATASAVWVRVDRVDASSGDDHLWLYYGNAAASDASDEAGTYDSNHVAVWHLDETRGPHVDGTTGISCTWQGGGGGTQDAVGQIAGAVELDGIEDVVACGDDQIVDTIDATITAWVRSSLTGDTRQGVVSVESLMGDFPGLSLYVRRSDGAIGTWSNNGYRFALDPTNRVTADEWAFLAIRSTRDEVRGLIEVSRNGGAWETIESGDTNDLRIDPGTPTAIGKWPGRGPDAGLRGTLDEIRISNVVRSDAWIRAQYLSSAGMFVTVGEAQSVCP